MTFRVCIHSPSSEARADALAFIAAKGMKVIRETMAGGVLYLDAA
jgi:hypothetical protein